MSINSSLYEGSVKHFRVRPKRHVLQYRLFSFLIDLSELDALHARLKLFSRNRFNLFTFRDSDFGVSGTNLQSYIESQLRDAGLFSKPARSYLLCSPRMLGLRSTVGQLPHRLRPLRALGRPDTFPRSRSTFNPNLLCSDCRPEYCKSTP